jgi:hypothetical protein
MDLSTALLGMLVVCLSPIVQAKGSVLLRGSTVDTKNKERQRRRRLMGGMGNTGGMASGAGTSSDTGVSVEFFHLKATGGVPVRPSTSSLNAKGDVFLFNNKLLDTVNATDIPGTDVAGVCTKSFPSGSIQIGLEGRGYCTFTYTLTTGPDGTPLDTFNAQGEVLDYVGGVLAITGGTGQMVRAAGSLTIEPGYADGAASFDFFNDAFVYLVNATIVF